MTLPENNLPLSMRVYTVYMLTNSVNGKVYIGYTGTNPEIRFGWHFRDKDKDVTRNRALARALRKYGRESFMVSTLEQVGRLQEAKAREIYYIALHKSNKCRYGYNMTPGGDGMSEATRQKLKAFHTGRKPSDETRLKMRLAKLGKPGNWLGKKRPELAAINKLKVGKKNPLWMKLPIAEIVSLYQSGMTTRAIAETMKCDHTTIMDHLVAEGVRLRTRQEAARVRRRFVIKIGFQTRFLNGPLES